MSTGMTEATGAPIAFREGINGFKANLGDGYEDHLRNPIANVDFKVGGPSVPDGDIQLSLIIGVDQTHQIPEHDAVFVSKTRTGQKNGSKGRIADMNGDAGGHQKGLTRLQGHRLIEAGAQIESRSAFRGVGGQGDGLAEARIKNLELDGFHDSVSK